ncbi:hypothetical protein F3Y22_tig00110694pilonHSYRG00063 [Hibiscus syriacus]|uniref:PUB 12/19-like N-terminal domain-containing protein n=1 Tax=Hibiscus syriacus TaxID=106335 RepID=A0A6A2ZUH1_HIBSY|nr:hypothetical protein F3Y22_tig00110694pilonHSYRG00063 [Hibiscus syriacus]
MPFPLCLCVRVCLFSFSSPFLLLSLSLIATTSNVAILFSAVIKDLRPCVNYLVKGSGKSPSTCCAGASVPASATTSSADKKVACACITSAAKNMKPKMTWLRLFLQTVESHCPSPFHRTSIVPRLVENWKCCGWTHEVIETPFYNELESCHGCIEGRKPVEALSGSSPKPYKAIMNSSKDAHNIALQKDQIAYKFQQMTEAIEATLNEIPYDELDISEEVQEHIELVHTQFRRAKGRSDSPDLQKEHDLAVAQKEKDPDPAILKRLSDKLQLKTINDLLKESVAFHELVIASGGDPGERFEEMASLLKKLNDYVLTENPETLYKLLMVNVIILFVM